MLSYFYDAQNELQLDLLPIKNAKLQNSPNSSSRIFVRFGGINITKNEFFY
jgi:hypothetical protein